MNLILRPSLKKLLVCDYRNELVKQWLWLVFALQRIKLFSVFFYVFIVRKNSLPSNPLIKCWVVYPQTNNLFNAGLKSLYGEVVEGRLLTKLHMNLRGKTGKVEQWACWRLYFLHPACTLIPFCNKKRRDTWLCSVHKLFGVVWHDNMLSFRMDVLLCFFVTNYLSLCSLLIPQMESSESLHGWWVPSKFACHWQI